jgi:ubiquinone/menaquinone biosynthesis C-methylase UbiE
VKGVALKSSGHRISLAKADSVAKSLWESDARAWDRYWVPIFSLFARQLALVSSPRPGIVILDVGTGSGLAVRQLCKIRPSVGLVVGIDSAEEMIRLARRKAASAGLRNVKFLKMLAQKLRFPDSFFDVVISNCGMSERLADFSQSVKEIFRVLRPGGVFVFNDWYLIDVKPHMIFGEILGRHRTTTPSLQLARERAALATVDATIDEEVQLRIVLKAGFKEASLVKRRHQVRLNSIEDYLRLRLCRLAVRREISEMTTSNRRMFLRDLRSALKQFVHDDVFIFNWPVYYIRAAKPH